MTKPQGIEFLTIIAARKYEDEILKMLVEEKGHLINVVYAKGSVPSGYFRDMLGLVQEEKKVMITCLVTSDVSAQVFEQLLTKFEFAKPNTGIAFAVPVDMLSV